MVATTTGKATELITFSRASLATVTASDGKIKWAPHNLLLASEQLDASNWAKGANVTVSANSAVAPNGTTTADKYSTSAAVDAAINGISQSAATGPSNVTIGVWLRAASAQTVQLRLLDGASTITNLSCSVTTTWTLFTVSGAITTGASTFFVIRPDGTNNISNLEWWGAHLYRSDLGGMVANTSAYPMYNPTTPKNLLGYSDQFDNAAWSKGGASVLANAIAAPNGTVSADKIVEDTSTGAHGVGGTAITGVANTGYVWSAYVKAAERSWVWINAYDGANRRCWFNLATGATGTVAAGCTATITAIIDGWYRISVARSAGSTTITFNIYSSTSDNSTSYTGDGTSGFYLWGAQLSDSASLDPYSPVIGAAPSAAAYYGPRLDYDPATLAAKGLLVEEQRTNLLTYSDALDNAAWSKAASSVTANAAISPTGTLTADLFIPDITTISHTLVNAAQSITSGVSYTISFYAKDSGYPYLRVIRGTSAAFPPAGTWFWNVSAGTFTGTLPSGWTNQSIISVGNGWYRCSVTVTATSTASDTLGIISTDNTGNATYAGNGTSGVYLWGMQMEVGAFATSYIPTAASTVTRSADVASVGTSQFPYGVTEGTIVASVDVLSTAITLNATLWAFYTDANNSIRSWIWTGNLGQPRGTIRQAGVQPADMRNGTITANTTFKNAFAYKDSDYGYALNGSAAASVTTSGAITNTYPVLDIGRSSSLGEYLNGHIRQITYIPRRLSSAELQARTL